MNSGSEAANSETLAIADNLTMHIAAMRPSYLQRTDIEEAAK
jgi:translation elongation factor EF-Ts